MQTILPIGSVGCNSNQALLVDKLIGSSYDVVEYVARNMDMIQFVARWLQASAEGSWSWAEGIPTTGAHTYGSMVWNSKPVSGGFIGWVCIQAGTPGIWEPFGPIGTTA